MEGNFLKMSDDLRASDLDWNAVITIERDRLCNVFEVGDKVYHRYYDYGYIKEKDAGVVRVYFTLYKQDIWVDPLFVSFTEYTLQGISQERPIELPEVGELCLVRDYDNREWSVKKFSHYEPKDNYPYRVERNDTGYKQMKRIKILD